MSRADRWIALGTPVVAMATVGIGLELGAPGEVRSVIVYGAPLAHDATRVAWSIVASDQRTGVRDPLPHVPIDLKAIGCGDSGEWKGETNDDGVAEAYFSLTPPAAAQRCTLAIASTGTQLAAGLVTWPPSPPRDRSPSPWAPFARREGPLEIDVAVLGERVAPSFAAKVWVRVRDAATHAPVAGVDVTPERDESLSSFTEHARTDSRGWAEIEVTPAGLAVSVAFDAASADGRNGTWIGGLVASPGAAHIATRSVWSPDENVEVALVAPPTRSAAYLEIDDGVGRAWATSIALGATLDGAEGKAQGPKLPRGLYWVVASGDSGAAASLGPGTFVRPFFVARNMEEALSLGPDSDACALPRDVRENARAVDSCLALAVATPVPRWVALDGFAAQAIRDGARHGRGLAVALGGVAAAVLLEGALLLRAAKRASVVGGEVPVEHRRWTVAVAVLLGLLGFALLAAFLVRMS